MTLQDFLDQLAPRVRDAFLAAIRDVTDGAILQQVTDAIEAGDTDGAFKALGFSPVSFNPLLAAIADVFQAGGTFVMSTFPKFVQNADGVKQMLRFNMRDKRAEDWLRDKSSTLVTELEDDVRQAVRDTLDVGLREGRNPRKVALDIVGKVNPATGQREGGVVGLGARERLWARGALQKLITLDPSYFDMELRDKRFDATVEAAIRDGKPLPRETIDKLVDRYRANALRHRGETVGRTETIHALNRSEWLATKQAVETGDLTASAVSREWDTVGDNRVRHAHREMDGQTVGLDEPFVAPDGDRLMHPGDTSLGASGQNVIACRCRVKTHVDWFAGVK